MEKDGGRRNRDGREGIEGIASTNNLILARKEGEKWRRKGKEGKEAEQKVMQVLVYNVILARKEG